MQVVHLDTVLEREPFSWVRGTNRFLPPDIAVQWAQPVPDNFHARASALARRYVYVLLESPVRPALESGRVGWSFRPLDEAAMREAEAIGPFAIVTGGAAWGPMLERLARGLRLHGEQTRRGLMAVHTVAASGGALRFGDLVALAELSSACVDVVAAQAHRARSLDAVILGGAALGGWARRLAPVPSVPVIDSVEAGARWLRRVAVA